jgi:hypothetical protein
MCDGVPTKLRRAAEMNLVKLHAAVDAVSIVIAFPSM